jgi:DNA-binding NtrC family response regulator
VADTFRPKSILVVDDDEAMLRAIERVLRGEGYQVSSARWVDEALEHLANRQVKFDLVITDMRMPMVSGRGILEAVRIALPRVPVIIVTAFGNPDLKRECLDRGAAAFLEKPLDTAQLLAAIESVLIAPQKD